MFNKSPRIPKNSITSFPRSITQIYIFTIERGKKFLVEAFQIPSGSMERTLLVGDFLFVNKALYGAEVPLVHARLPAVREPRRNDILVFDSVEEEGLKVVKRLIGMPGDTLHMRLTVLESRPMKSRPGVGLIKIRHEVVNQHGQAVMEMQGYGMFGRRDA